MTSSRSAWASSSASSTSWPVAGTLVAEGSQGAGAARRHQAARGGHHTLRKARRGWQECEGRAGGQA
eukprot:4867081-Pyramimonas_sp.AAC.1